MNNQIGLINIIVLFLVGTLNLVNIIYLDGPLMAYCIYVIPFYTMIIPVWLMWHKNVTLKIYALLFVLLGMCVTILGQHGNATGIIFICFSLYIYHSKRIIFFTFASLILSLVIKYLLNGFDFVKGMNLIIVYAYVLFIYYDLIHPKKPELQVSNNMDDINKEIVELLAAGYRPKEIGEKTDIFLSVDAVRKRIQRMCKQFDCETTEQLIYQLYKRGLFSH